MAIRRRIRISAWVVAASRVAILLRGPTVLVESKDQQGDVSDMRVIGHVTEHPYAVRIWQPFIIQGEREGDLSVAFGAIVNGKKDTGKY